MDKLFPKGSPTQGMNFSGAGWILWAVAIVCLVFTLWLLIDAWRVRRKIQHGFLGEGPGKAGRSTGSCRKGQIRDKNAQTHIE